MIGLLFFLWHINSGRLFNAKTCLYINLSIKYDWFAVLFMAYQPL